MCNGTTSDFIQYHMCDFSILSFANTNLTAMIFRSRLPAKDIHSHEKVKVTMAVPRFCDL